MRALTSHRLIRLVAADLFLAASLGACYSPDEITRFEPPTSGTIVVSVLPPSLEVSWDLAGPENLQQAGTGSDTLATMPAGTYILTWGPVEGWSRVEPAREDYLAEAELSPGDTLVLAAEFLEIPPVWDTWVTIPAGAFFMGATDSEDTALRNEKPRHEVTLTRSFRMQATEVTNGQYLERARWALDQGLVTADADGLWDNLDGSSVLLMDFSDLVGGLSWSEIEFHGGQLRLRDVGHGLNPDHPVKMVTWYGAAAYCNWLSQAEGLPRAYDHRDWVCHGGDPYGAEGYRLPTEAEWEYACRAGTTTAFYSGDITDPWGPFEPALETVAWYQGNSVDWTHPVGQLEPNAWGLHDMHGNLFKWVNGFEFAYGAEAVADPVSPMTGGNRVAKGGAWTRPSHYHRVAFRRLRDTLDYRGPKQGFRPVQTASR